jgi:hypothetical protein
MGGIRRPSTTDRQRTQRQLYLGRRLAFCRLIRDSERLAHLANAAETHLPFAHRGCRLDGRDGVNE